MRKQNETLVACYNVAVYASTEKLTDPSGSGSDPQSFQTELTKALEEHIPSAVQDEIQSEFSEWNDALRTEIQTIA